MFETVNTGGKDRGAIRALLCLTAGCVGSLTLPGCKHVPQSPAPVPAASTPAPRPAVADTKAEIRRLADEAEKAAAEVTFPPDR